LGKCAVFASVIRVPARFRPFEGLVQGQNEVHQLETIAQLVPRTDLMKVTEINYQASLPTFRPESPISRLETPGNSRLVVRRKALQNRS
ncbi:hypothetical protein OE509_34470, partial [Pseudomonas aeruginosa]|nr:hypothetical protein [Pseudomonas aeruginosa]MCU9124586.1 hypothetical protein [Pseudomonas aeruginosa]